MGTILKASCTCGFKTKELYFGAGMENHLEECMVPCLKNGSTTVEMFNIKKKRVRLEYVFYNEEILCGNNNTSRKIQSYPIDIFENDNLCPICGNYQLSFKSCGSFS